MLITRTRLGFLSLLVFYFFIALVESISDLKKETLTVLSEHNDRNDTLSSLSSEFPVSSSSSQTPPIKSSLKSSSTSTAESISSPTTSPAKTMELSTSIEPLVESSSTKFQSMEKEIETQEIRAAFLPPATTKSISHGSSLSQASHLASSMSAVPTLQPDDDDLDGDIELIRTESIQEARLARKKQRATPRPTQPFREEKKTELESAPEGVHPHQNTNIKEQPVLQEPNEPTENANSNIEMHPDGDEPQPSAADDQDAPGLGKIGTALVSVGGVLMVAGITGGIFVWRAQHQQQGLPQHQSPSPSVLMSSHPTALNLLDDSNNSAGKYQTPSSTPLSKVPQSQHILDLNNQGPTSASTDFASFERHDLMNNWQNGLDFNYSMEKLFNNHTRPPHHPSARNSRASPAQEKTQIDSPSVNTSYHPFSASSSTQLPSATHPLPTGESSSNLHNIYDADHPSYEDYAQGLHAASPISIYFPSSSPTPQSPPLLQQECKVNINLVHKDT